MLNFGNPNSLNRHHDLASVLTSHEILDAWLRRNGLGRLEYLHDDEARRQAVLNQAFDGYHQIGLSRMAETPADGVADANCRVHGIANLYLAGSCLFPTGGHANPTLPAVALALRLAEHLKDAVAGTPRI
ncbi:GMC family oxidoreductase [Rhizobium puerariae]|uniref:GMC family oxidoreductase n=1 Tax=Rhizobium puerariae TaxID=1585791 RepID=A0ABV6AG20_9HYPH